MHNHDLSRFDQRAFEREHGFNLSPEKKSIPEIPVFNPGRDLEKARAAVDFKRARSAVTPLNRKLEFPCHAFVANCFRLGLQSASACNGACNFSLETLAHDSAGEKLRSLSNPWNNKLMIVMT